jgi:hypothetical protein
MAVMHCVTAMLAPEAGHRSCSSVIWSLEAIMASREIDDDFSPRRRARCQPAYDPGSHDLGGNRRPVDDRGQHAAFDGNYRLGDGRRTEWAAQRRAQCDQALPAVHRNGRLAGNGRGTSKFTTPAAWPYRRADGAHRHSARSARPACCARARRRINRAGTRGETQPDLHQQVSHISAPVDRHFGNSTYWCWRRLQWCTSIGA